MYVIAASAACVTNTLSSSSRCYMGEISFDRIPYWCLTGGEAERLGKLSLKDAVGAVNDEALVSEETGSEDGELQEGAAC